MKSRFMYWAPWGVTRPWCPRLFRGCDEHHNRSVALVAPFLGAFIFFWESGFTRETPEHLSGWDGEKWEGDFYPGCLICWEIRTDCSGII